MCYACYYDNSINLILNDDKNIPRLINSGFVVKQNNIIFKEQFSFNDCLSDKNYKLFFDFAIFEDDKLKYLIEYQGIQHYQESIFSKYESLQERQNRDNIKREYCKSHNIKLIEIPYWDYEKINYSYIKEKINNE